MNTRFIKPARGAVNAIRQNLMSFTVKALINVFLKICVITIPMKIRVSSIPMKIRVDKKIFYDIIMISY